MKRTILLGQIIFVFHFQVKRGAPCQAFNLFSTTDLWKDIWSWKKTLTILTPEPLPWIFKEGEEFLRKEIKNEWAVPQKVKDLSYDLEISILGIYQ